MVRLNQQAEENILEQVRGKYTLPVLELPMSVRRGSRQPKSETFTNQVNNRSSRPNTKTHDGCTRTKATPKRNQPNMQVPEEEKKLEPFGRGVGS